MSYDYGYGELENQLINACRQYPPDFEEIQILMEKGADLNAPNQSHSEENVLSEIILYYPEIQNEVENTCSGDGGPYEDSHPPDGTDGRYLPYIIQFFLEHGFQVKRDKNSNCLRHLIYASRDSYILTCAKLLLHAGADPNRTEDGETVLSSVATEASYQRCCEANFVLENLFETLYEILNACVKGENYLGIEYYAVCINRRIDSVLLCPIPNVENPILTADRVTWRHKNSFRSPIIFFCEGKPLCVTQYADIFVNPNAIPDMPGRTRDISSYFKDCIGRTILSIMFEYRTIRKDIQGYSQPIILIGLDNGRTIQISINDGEVPREDMVCHFDII